MAARKIPATSQGTEGWCDFLEAGDRTGLQLQSLADVFNPERGLISGGTLYVWPENPV